MRYFTFITIILVFTLFFPICIHAADPDPPVEINNNEAEDSSDRPIPSGDKAAAARQQTPTAERRTDTNQKGILLNFKDAPLETILEYLSEVADLVVITDTQIDDRLTVISRQPLTVDESVSLINSILLERNYAAIKMGRTLKIVPLEQAKQMNIPVRSGNNPHEIIPGDDMVTHVIPIRYANAAKLKDELAPLVPSYASLTANTESNALVITDTTANIKRIIEIVCALDTHMSAVAEVKVFHLKYCDATNTARLINEIFQADEQASQGRRESNPFERMMMFRGRGGRNAGGRENRESSGSLATSKVVASADDRTNTVVVSGPPDTLKIIDNVIKDLDSNPLEEQSVLTYPLSNARAENLKEVLNNLFQEMERILNQGATGGSGRTGQTQRSFNRSFNRGFNANTTTGSGTGDLAGQIYFEADEDTNSLLVITASKNFDRVKKIIKDLDKPVPQVLIKVLIAEVSHDESLDLGTEFSMINLRHTGGSTSTATNFGIGAATGGLVVNTLEGDLDITLRALATEGKLNVLSRPYILTSNNQAAAITIGEEVPFIRNTRTTETGQTINTIEYEPIGIILEVTPSINPQGLVIMDVKPEISTQTNSTIPISETVDAAVFAKRSSESRVAIRDGQTIVIGGLVEDLEIESAEKIPLLGDIPLLGLLFQRKETKKTKKELLIFLTPYVAMEEAGLNKITEQEKVKSNLFQNPSQFPPFQEHFKAMQDKEKQSSE